MSRSTEERLTDALLHLDRAIEYGASGATSELELDAICMRISACIEALHGLPRPIREELFGEMWHAMWGMRNRIAHTYARVERTVVLATLQQDLPVIRAAIMGFAAR